MIRHESPVWNYLSTEQRILADDGAFLIEDSALHRDAESTDYSYLVFPFAKLYEGFLKDVFLDLTIISKQDYASGRFRIGKVLNPNIVKQLHGKSAYGQLCNRYGQELADLVWHAWKEGRNLVFHYFPGNFRMLSRDRALETVALLIQAMESLLRQTGVSRLGG